MDWRNSRIRGTNALFGVQYELEESLLPTAVTDSGIQYRKMLNDFFSNETNELNVNDI